MNLLSIAAEEGYDQQIKFVKTDVAHEPDVVAKIDCAVDSFGSLDILFNNAGVGGAIGPVWELEADDWDYTFDVLVKGFFWV